MPNRQLDASELEKANGLLDLVRSKIKAMSCGDPALEFAFRRKVFKELSYDERGRPALRKALKVRLRKLQNDTCPLCGKGFADMETDLHRLVAQPGYTVENVQLVHRTCHRQQQADHGFA